MQDIYKHVAKTFSASIGYRPTLRTVYGHMGATMVGTCCYEQFFLLRIENGYTTNKCIREWKLQELARINNLTHIPNILASPENLSASPLECHSETLLSRGWVRWINCYWNRSRETGEHVAVPLLREMNVALAFSVPFAMCGTVVIRLHPMCLDPLAHSVFLFLLPYFSDPLYRHHSSTGLFCSSLRPSSSVTC